MEDQNENPYVAVLSKKLRNIKKKYDRVVQMEAQMKEGKKTLNEEQLIAVASKPGLEKALSEIESLKRQLEDIAEQEKRHPSSAAAVTSSPAVVEAAAPAESAQTEMIDSSTFTHQVELVANSTQYDQESPSAPSNKPEEKVIQDSELLRGHLHKILKLFHVCSRYSVLSGGNALPPDINYFGKCLLGETSIDCFSKTLNQSVRNAELYLDEELGSQYEAIRGMSYSQISEIIDTLANQLPVPASPLPPRPPSPPPQSPQINFFADGGIAEPGDASHFQENYNAPIGSFAPSSSPFPLPPSAVAMYDQWSTSEASPPLSPSALAASALGGVIGAPVSDPVPVEVVESQEQAPTSQGAKRGGRGGSSRGKGRGRGRGKEHSNPGEGEVKPESVDNAQSASSSDIKKGVSWGGQQNKAGGALAAVTGAVEATTEPRVDQEGGRVSGRGRGRGRGYGRGGRNEGASAAPVAASDVVPSSSSEGGRGGRGRGAPRGRGGRGSSRGEGGRGAGGRSQGNAKPAPAAPPATA